MAIHKVIEVIAESSKSWEDAAHKALAEAGKSVKGIKSIWIKDLYGEVDAKGKIKSYRANCHITFEVKSGNSD